MKLQKLLDRGAFTITGEVIYLSPSIRGQVKIADWKGGEDCVLTAVGERLADEGEFDPAPQPVEIPSFKRPKKDKGLADLDLGDGDAT